MGGDLEGADKSNKIKSIRLKLKDYGELSEKIDRLFISQMRQNLARSHR